jgi:hypothetical protein
MELSDSTRQPAALCRLLLEYSAGHMLQQGGASLQSGSGLNNTIVRDVSDRLCGLVVRVLGYRSGSPGSIPGTTRKKNSSGSGTGFTQTREYN